MKVYSVTARPLADESNECLKGWSNQDLFDWQREDPAMNRVIGWLETSSERPRGVAQYDGRSKAYLAQWEALFLNKHGILCRKWYPQVLTWAGLRPSIESGTGSTGQGTNRSLSDCVADATFVHEVNPVQRENEVN